MLYIYVCEVCMFFISTMFIMLGSFSSRFSVVCSQQRRKSNHHHLALCVLNQTQYVVHTSLSTYYIHIQLHIFFSQFFVIYVRYVYIYEQHFLLRQNNKIIISELSVYYSIRFTIHTDGFWLSRFEFLVRSSFLLHIFYDSVFNISSTYIIE